jgi:hypothetical protein
MNYLDNGMCHFVYWSDGFSNQCVCVCMCESSSRLQTDGQTDAEPADALTTSDSLIPVKFG